MKWIWLLLLGGVHGVNPGMGWLFAVALGLQERSARAVWRALLPLAIGHAVAIGGVLILASLAGLVIPPGALKWIVALTLVMFAAARLVRHRHFVWGGMQVGMRDLAVWSLLMASAHGAGLMVLPVLLAGDRSAEVATVHAAGEHAHHLDATPAPGGGGRAGGLAATLVHTAGYLLVTGLMAALVYFWAGLHLLRAAWINLDLIWAIALGVTGVVTVLGQ